MNEGTAVNIDLNRVVERLARRIAELEVTVAQQAAVIAVLIDGGEAGDDMEEVPA